MDNFTFDQPIGVTNPEAARSLVLATYFLRTQDFSRAAHYARLPMVAGSGLGAKTLLSGLIFSRKYEAVAELAATLFANSIHHATRTAVMEDFIPALCFLGGRDGDCTEAYRAAYEMARQGNLNPDKQLWQGQPLHGKTLLLSLSGDGFGGLGDYIMWARFVPDLAALGPRIIVQCSGALARLFATLPGVVSTCGLEDRPPCDYAISIMQVPHVLGLSGVPVANPFNVAPVTFPQEKFRIGINWGASWVAPYMDRSCALTEYLPLMQIPQATLYAVQKGAYQRQLHPCPVGFEAIDLAPKLGDFLDTAIVISSMDAVVTTDNAVANLSCMLGMPTFVLAPKGADWRWGEAGRTPWYPSARVYQQETVGEWGNSIACLVRDLSAYLQSDARQLPAPVQFNPANGPAQGVE